MTGSLEMSQAIFFIILGRGLFSFNYRQSSLF